MNVTHNHAYQQVELNAGIPGEIENILGKLHKALHEVNCVLKTPAVTTILTFYYDSGQTFGCTCILT